MAGMSSMMHSEVGMFYGTSAASITQHFVHRVPSSLREQVGQDFLEQL